MGVIDWDVENIEHADRVMLSTGPVARLVPDGCRVQVVVYHEAKTYHDHSRPVGERNVTEQVRVASVSLVDADGNRDKTLASVRFGNTEASGSCWARCIEGKRYDRKDTGEVYWRTDQTTGWRLDGFATDLPDGAMRAMRDVFSDAAEYVAKRFPELWAGADEVKAKRNLQDAESDALKARDALKAARAAYGKACKAHERAEIKARKRVQA